LKKSYSRFGLNIELSIGDFDIDDSKLKKADIIISTYEKMDSLIRNFYDKKWIFKISTIIIDEIHIIGEESRGPRLESLIVRINKFLHNPQIIGLSATIANPEFFNSWLNSLGNKTILIKSDLRPVPLHYHIEVSQNKDSTIKRIVNKVLKKKGQVLIFLNRRRATLDTAILIKNIVKNLLEENEKKKIWRIEKRLKKIRGGHHDLQKIIKNGVAFHHAGLLPKERKLIEDYYRKRVIKVICCTTTLSAGVNTPARLVILKDFKKFTTTAENIKNYSGFHENGDGFSYFKPFSSNEVFQMLGRAGRPGLDSIGHGIILVNNFEEKSWIEDHYFTCDYEHQLLLPKYGNLGSGLNTINTLKEQVLLRVYEEVNITFLQLKEFFEKTYFWFIMKNQMKQIQIPIDQLLMIKEISPSNILKLHSNSHRIEQIKRKQSEIKITKLNSGNISGYVKTDFGVFFTEFDIDNGIKCSCGFENGLSDNFAEQKFTFEFCDHITEFLIYLLEFSDKNIKKHINNIIPKSIKNQYILSYLFEKGLLLSNQENLIKCSQFGKLIIRLYLYPASGVLIRNKLEKKEITSYKDLIKGAYEILIAENRVKNHKMLEPILEWTDEEPIDSILERHNVMAGDLYSLKDNIERIITFIGIIAIHLSSSGQDIRDNMILIGEMSETLRIRIHYGIREELFDLVLRLENVARMRARVLYNAGYHTASQITNINPYLLHRKTGLGVNLCKKIVKSLNIKSK